MKWTGCTIEALLPQFENHCFMLSKIATRNGPFVILSTINCNGTNVIEILNTVVGEQSA